MVPSGLLTWAAPLPQRHWAPNGHERLPPLPSGMPTAYPSLSPCSAPKATGPFYGHLHCHQVFGPPCGPQQLPSHWAPGTVLTSRCIIAHSCCILLLRRAQPVWPSSCALARSPTATCHWAPQHGPQHRRLIAQAPLLLPHHWATMRTPAATTSFLGNPRCRCFFEAPAQPPTAAGRDLFLCAGLQTTLGVPELPKESPSLSGFSSTTHKIQAILFSACQHVSRDTLC